MEPGQLLGGRFLIIGELGRGGMATVYLVDDTIRGDRIALKVLHEHLADDADARRRLTREVRASGRIQHPNALVANDIHDLGGRLALSMPVHRGMTLADLIDADGPMPAAALDRLARELSGALAAAHNVGVIHRDVGPNNVLVERGGAAVLADFGLARLEGNTTRTAAAGPGTWGYAAPEVYSGSHGDPRSDVYSLGASLYFAATGKAPFAASNPGAILKRQLDGDFEPLAEVRPDLPASLVASIEGMLAVEPEQRTQGAREVQDALLVGEAPAVPVAQASEPAGDALKAGMYTVIVQKTRREARAQRARRLPGALTRLRSPLGLDEASDAEKSLSRAVRGQTPEVLPAAMRRSEYKLVEGVSEAAASRIADEAVGLGFVPRIVNDPRVRFSKDRGQEKFVAAMVLFVIAAAAFVDAHEAGGFRMIVLSLVAFFSSVSVFAWGQNQIRLRLAFERAAPRLASAEAAPSADPLMSMFRRTDGKLRSLESALIAQDDVPDLLHDQLAATLAALRGHASGLVEPVKRLGVDLLPDADAADAVQRIHKRLQRMETMARAGERVDAREREELEQGLEAHLESQRAREEAEALRTRIAARLLEIGAAATRATRVLRRDGDAGGSLRTLLDQLVTESEAAAEVVTEVEELGDAARLRRARLARGVQ